MMTMRSHDQFNTTIYGLDDRYRGIHNGRRVVFLNPEDIQESETEKTARPSISRVTSKAKSASRAVLSSCRIVFRVVAPQPIFRKRTCSCPCATLPTRVTPGVEVGGD